MKVYPIRQKTDQQKFELYLKATNTRNYCLWILGTNTGLRISDLLKLKVSDVQGNFLNITEQKTNKLKRVKLNSKVKSVITDFVKGMKTTDILFGSRQGRANVAISIRQAQRIIKSVAQKLGLDDNINSHSMRKTYAWNIYQASGQNIALVMDALNHSSQAITLKYLCVMETMIDDVTEMLACI